MQSNGMEEMRSRKNQVLRQCFAINFGSRITCSALSCCIIPKQIYNIICINKYILTLKFHLFFYFVFILFFKLLYTFLYYSLFIVLLFSLFYFIYLSIYLYLFYCFFLFRFLIFFNLKLEIEKILLFPSLKCKNEKKILNNIFNF